MGKIVLVTIKNMKVGFCTDLVVFAWNIIIMQKATRLYYGNALKLHISRVYHDLLFLPYYFVPFYFAIVFLDKKEKDNNANLRVFQCIKRSIMM